MDGGKSNRYNLNATNVSRNWRFFHSNLSFGERADLGTAEDWWYMQKHVRNTNANKAEAMQIFWRNGSFSMAPMTAQSILQSGSCPWMLTCWAGFPFTQVDDVLKVPNFQAATFGSRYFNKLHLIFRLIRGALPHSHARSAFCSDWWINCCVWR